MRLLLLRRRCSAASASASLSKLELQQLTLPLLVLLQRTVAWYQNGYEHGTMVQSSTIKR